MDSLANVGVALLAAGQSRRFGRANKLVAPFRGKPLWLHAAEALSHVPVAHRWMIVGDASQAVANGFAPVVNQDASAGMGTSVALAASLAEQASSDAVLIALADMPLVPASHFARLIARASPQALVASHDGCAAMPPALFGRDHFDRLQQISPQSGARAMLRSAETLQCDQAWLVDVDTPEALRDLS